MAEALLLSATEHSPPPCHWLAAPAGIACGALALASVATGLPQDAPHTCPWLQWLSEAERRRFAQLPVHKRRLEWLAGRLAAKQAWQRLHRCPDWPLHTSVRADALGRPRFDDAALSISHSRCEALVAVAHVPVGIDTETFDALRAGSLSVLLRPDEVQAVQRGWQCDAWVARTLLWCLKEALFKATGGAGSFVHFAVALRVHAWSPGDVQPAWAWRSEAERRPLLAPWRAQASLTGVAARVLVSPLPAPTPGSPTDGAHHAVF